MAETIFDRLGPELNSVVFLGEAGCGKSEIAVNLALRLAAGERPVHFFDLDMTKPLFRSRDAARLLEDGGVTVHYEEQFMDAPTLTGGVNRLLRDRSVLTVLDVGGDHIGARAVGGYAPLLNRPETMLCYVVNPYRPWSMTLEHIDRVLGETLGASHLRLDRLHMVGNPNLGRDTTPEDVLAGEQTLLELVGPYKPVELLCVREDMAAAAAERAVTPVFPLKLHMTYPWEEDLPGSC